MDVSRSQSSFSHASHAIINSLTEEVRDLLHCQAVKHVALLSQLRALVFRSRPRVHPPLGELY